jgi:hypothetical protein
MKRLLRFILVSVAASLWQGLAAEIAPKVVPLTRAHAHNDYEHARPLLDALDHGFCSIEADVFLVDGRLLVGHDLKRTSPERTLDRLYLDPLRERTKQNGGRIYPGGPVCWLFIDLKTEAGPTYTALNALLTSYPDLVTRFESNRVVTNAVSVIVTGNRPRETIAAQSPRYAGYDGLLTDLESGISPLLVPVISENWFSHFQWRGRETMPEAELTRLKGLVAKAHGQGRQLRFWGAPDHAGFWQAMHDAKVDLINSDKLDGLRDFLLGR